MSVTSDRALDGSMKFHYCPHASGCRSVIRNLNASPFFNIGRVSVALEFAIPENSSTWIVSSKTFSLIFMLTQLLNIAAAVTEFSCCFSVKCSEFQASLVL